MAPLFFAHVSVTREGARWRVRWADVRGRRHSHRAPRWIRTRAQAKAYAGRVVLDGTLYPPVRVPDEWPTFGTFRGRRVRLRELVRWTPRHELPETIIELPGIGRCRPWKGLWQPGDTM